MKATLEFTLPEDQNDYEVAIQAQRVQAFLYDFSQQLRSWYKYHHDFKDADDALSQIRDEFYKLSNENSIYLDL